MESHYCTLIQIFIVLTLTVQHSHPLQRHYVKPHENTTCPGDPCLTLEAYTDANDLYFTSDVEFVFMYGEHYFNANLRLTNLSNVHFQGEELLSDFENQTIQIIFTPLAKLVFVMSSNITMSHLSVSVGGSPTGLSDLFQTIGFQDSTARLFDAFLQGSENNSVSSTAIRCHSSHIDVTNIKIVGAKSTYGAALLLYNSTATLSGNNIFANNSASNGGGAIFALASSVTISGNNSFEENHALYFGGAIGTQQTTIELTGTVLFIHNKALQFNGGAVHVERTQLTLNSGRFYFFENSAGALGGAMVISSFSSARIIGNMIVRGNKAIQGSVVVITFSILVSVGGTLFTDNLAHSGGAISVQINSQMYLPGAVIENNYANFSGGGLLCGQDSHAIIENSLMAHNRVDIFGGAIDSSSGSLQLTGSNRIEHNWSKHGGGGMFTINSTGLTFMGNNFFTNNTSDGYGGGISITLTNASIRGTLHFINNRGHQGGAVYALFSKIDFDQYANVTFIDNAATSLGGASHSTDVTWNISGTILFKNNSATMGGAMSLTGNSKLIFNKFSDLTYMENHADTSGSSIFFGDTLSIDRCKVFKEDVAFCYKPNSKMLQLCTRLSDCFIELNADFPFDHSSSNVSVRFLNNSAGKSGTVIFGGSLDNCRLYLGGGFQDSCGNKIGREYTETPLPIILEIFMIDNLTSAVSSEPFRVCFCDHNGVPDCEMNVAIDTIRGKQFTLSAVTVGQGNFTVTSSIKADFDNRTSTSTRLSQLQRVQDTGNTCTDVSYRLFSADNFVTMILFPDGPCRDTGIARHEVKVTFLPCPDGFINVGTECTCDKRLSTFNTSCNVDRGTVERTENSFWMMAIYDNSSYQGLLLHDARCPFDFCVERAVEINLENPNIQCNHNHSGILCGSCQDGLSLALGSLHCHSCSNTYLSLILVFALAGVALVVILLLLQLTVAYGTMNGLIFYANVVQVNRDIFFPPGATNVLTVFIAWLNLDLGIDTCFYDGMNAYAFIWLQFVFPFYVWFLIGFIIFLSHYSERISRCLGDNPVSVLATLILLSYSKILRTIIAVLSRTTLQYPDGSSQHVWLYDGSVPYFQRVDHIVLGVFAISALLLLFLPYTILLLCAHWLQAYSHWKIFSWINKLKPFMDAYHAPFKKESRYWIGFLLLVRCVLFLTFAFNALGNASINLLTITSVTVGLAALAWLQNQLYEKIHNDILEASFILNLCIFAAATYHVKEITGRQDKLAYTSVGIAFVFFCGILLYHACQRIHKTSIWKKLSEYDKCKGYSRSLIRSFSHNDKKKGDETNGQPDDIQLQDTEIVLSPTTTVIELREPFLDY